MKYNVFYNVNELYVFQSVTHCLWIPLKKFRAQTFNDWMPSPLWTIPGPAGSARLDSHSRDQAHRLLRL